MRSGPDLYLDAVQVPLAYAEKGTSLIQALIGKTDPMIEYAHHPRDDVVDPGHGSRFYYHAHPSHQRSSDEHGHVHVFQHLGEKDFVHVVGISLNHRSEPIRLFTTNQWVTAERLRSAAELGPLIDGFEVKVRGCHAPLARWVTAMVRLFAPQIHRLVLRRDEMLQRRAERVDRAALLEDRRLDVISQQRISLPDRFKQLGLA